MAPLPGCWNRESLPGRHWELGREPGSLHTPWIGTRTRSAFFFITRLDLGSNTDPYQVHPWRRRKVDHARNSDDNLGDDKVEPYNWDAYLASYLETLEREQEHTPFRTIPLPSCSHVETSGGHRSNDNFDINWRQVCQIAVAILFSYVSASCLVFLRIRRSTILIQIYTGTLTPAIRSNTVHASNTNLDRVAESIGLPNSSQEIELIIDIENSNRQICMVSLVKATPTVSISPRAPRFPSVKNFQLDPRPTTPPAPAAEVVELTEEEKRKLVIELRDQRRRERLERTEKEREILQQRRLEKERMRQEKEEKKTRKQEWRVMLKSKRLQREAPKRLEMESAQKQYEPVPAQLSSQEEQQPQVPEADLAQHNLENEERQTELLQRQEPQQQSPEAPECQPPADHEQLRADQGEAAEEPQTEGQQADSDNKPPGSDKDNDNDNEGCGVRDTPPGNDTDENNDGNEAGNANTSETRSRKKKQRCGQRARQRKRRAALEAQAQAAATHEEVAVENGEEQAPGPQTRTPESAVVQNNEAFGAPEEPASDSKPQPQGCDDDAALKEAQDQLISRIEEQSAAVPSEHADLQAAQDAIINRLQQQQQPPPQPQAFVNPQAPAFHPQAFRPAVAFHHQFPQQAVQFQHPPQQFPPYPRQPYHQQQFQPQLPFHMPAYPAGHNQMAVDPAYRPGTPMAFSAGPVYPPPPPSTSNSDNQSHHNGF